MPAFLKRLSHHKKWKISLQLVASNLTISCLCWQYLDDLYILSMSVKLGLNPWFAVKIEEEDKEGGREGKREKERKRFTWKA